LNIKLSRKCINNKNNNNNKPLHTDIPNNNIIQQRNTFNIKTPIKFSKLLYSKGKNSHNYT